MTRGGDKGAGVPMSLSKGHSAEKDALAVLDTHLPFETYNGLLGSVVRCGICGETAGTNPLDALRRHDVATLARHGFLNPTRDLPPGEADG